jgi:hypothetical protein
MWEMAVDAVVKAVTILAPHIALQVVMGAAVEAQVAIRVPADEDMLHLQYVPVFRQ